MAVEVDGLRLGIRAQDDAHQAWLAELLDGRLVDDPDVPANYSVRVSDHPRSLHLLYRGGCLAARCRSIDELVSAIDAHLGGHGPVPEGAVRLGGLLLRRDRDAVLITNVDQQYGTKLASRLRDSGITSDVRPWADVDAGSLVLQSAGSVGLAAPGKDAFLRLVLVPPELAALEVADRTMALERSGGLHLVGGSLFDAITLVRSVLTERVDDYGIANAAEALRKRFDDFARFPQRYKRIASPRLVVAPEM